MVNIRRVRARLAGCPKQEQAPPDILCQKELVSDPLWFAKSNLGGTVNFTEFQPYL